MFDEGYGNAVDISASPAVLNDAASPNKHTSGEQQKASPITRKSLYIQVYHNVLLTVYEYLFI